MPCRDYYDEHPAEYFQEVTEPALKKRIAFAESALCAVLSVFDDAEYAPNDELWGSINFKAAGITSEELARWHVQHLVRDKLIRDEKIKKVLAKLTPEEIELLGLDKQP